MGRTVLYARPRDGVSFGPVQLKELEPQVDEALQEMLKQGYTAKVIPGIEFVGVEING